MKFTGVLRRVVERELPGLGGAVSFEDRTHEWSGRLMWRENGKAEFYVHVPAGNQYDPGERFWWNTEGFQAQFIPGRWHHIEIHTRLNTPGQFDGRRRPCIGDTTGHQERFQGRP